MQYFRLWFVVLVIVLLGTGCGPRRQLTGDNTLRVLTYNVHHGEGIDGKVDVKRIATLINDSRADIVALQEVDRWTERTKKIDMMTELADLTDLTYAFGKTINIDGGDYGNGVLTRFPILEERNVLHPVMSNGEQRALMQLVLDVRGREIVFMNTHLDYREDNAERLASAEHILETAKKYEPRLVLLCGDMNDLPGSQAVGLLKQYFTDSWEISGSGDGFSFSASQPVKRIDYIFVSRTATETGFSLRPVSARVLRSEASDHLPVLVEFEIVNN